MIHGPGSPGVFFSMPLGAELQVQWIGACIRHLVENGLGTVETTAMQRRFGMNKSKVSRTQRFILRPTLGIWEPIFRASRGSFWAI